MKKIQASNWISAARSVSPQSLPSLPARSAMASPRTAVAGKSQAYQEAASN